MKATEFVKQYGLDSFLIAKSLPKFYRYRYVIFYTDEIDFSNEFHAEMRDYMFDVADVKRLIESHELVDIYDGLDVAKDCLTVENFKRKNLKHWNRLKQAIADVEACQ